VIPVNAVSAAPSVERAIDVRGVSKWFPVRRRLRAPWRAALPVRALDDVTFHVRPGSTFALIGPNGAGKTTLLRVLATLCAPDEGEVRVDGVDPVREPAAARKAVSFAMGQERSFYWRLTCRQNLAFFAALYDLDRRSTGLRIDGLARIFALEDALDRPYEQLSTGTRQRLALARSLLNDGSILLADEPTRSLDPLLRDEFKSLILRLSREQGRTVLFTTHDLHEAAEVADLTGVMHRGRLRAILTARDLQSLQRQGRLDRTFADLCDGAAIGSDAA
jgi:ABC-type multidrug transport system ATPase subunit